MSTPSPWKDFSLEELACPHCGKQGMNADFMDKVVKVRKLFNAPMPVTSGYRCPEYNAQIGGIGPSHEGRALDINLYGQEGFRFLECLFDVNKSLPLGTKFTGLELNQPLGSDCSTRHIHIDDMTSQEIPTRPFIWTPAKEAV